MSKSKLKTTQTDVPAQHFIASIENVQRQTNAKQLLKLFNRITGLKPTMWGGSIIGYGRYHYRYDSGREGEFFMPGYQDISAMLERLGKHKTGKSCLYINKLNDIDIAVLEEVICYGLDYMRANYETFDC